MSDDVGTVTTNKQVSDIKVILCAANADPVHVLAALTANNFIIFKVPKDIKVAHGARLVLAHPWLTKGLYTIEVTP